MEKDPVCGMTVDPARAKATQEHAGKMYYFCCRGCQEKFSAEPAKYLLPNTLLGIAPAPPKPLQITPAPPRSPHLHAAKNASVPVARTISTRATDYTSPMDPDARPDGPV